MTNLGRTNMPSIHKTKFSLEGEFHATLPCLVITRSVYSGLSVSLPESLSLSLSLSLCLCVCVCISFTEQ